MKPFAQAWILALEHKGPEEVVGQLSICGDTTQLEVESFEFFGSSSKCLEELGSVLDATMWSFLAIADGTFDLEPTPE